MLVSIGFLAKHYGVSVSTIRRWCREGELEVHHRTFGGHRRFEFSQTAPNGESRKIIGYARVSSHDQKSDLQRQIQRLKSSGCDEVLSDIGSGLNCKKPGLRALLQLILRGKVGTLRLVHEDRLIRFGTEIIRHLCRHKHTAFDVLETPATTASHEAELAKDVITLMTVFCARLYGMRSHKNRRNSKGLVNE